MLAQDPMTGYFHEVPDGQLYDYGYEEYPELAYGETPVVYDGFGNPVGLPFLAPIAAAVAPMAGRLIRRLVERIRQRRAAGAGGAMPRGAVPSLPPMPAMPFSPMPAMPFSPMPAMPAMGPGMAPFPGAMPLEPEAALGYDGLGNPVGLFPFLPPPASLAPGVRRLVGGLMPGRPGVPAPVQRPQLPAFSPARMPFPYARPFGPRPFFRAPPPVGWVTPALPFTGTRPRRMYLRCAVWPGPGGLIPGFANQPAPPPVAAPTIVRRRRRR